MGYAVCNELREFVLAPVTHSVMQKTGTRVFGHLLQMDHRDKYTREPGGTAMMLEKGYQGMHVMHSGLLFNLLPTIAEMGYVGYLMFFQLGGNFASIGAAVAATYTLWTLKMTQAKSVHRKKGNAIDRKSSSKVIDSLFNFDSVKYFQNEKHEVEQYQKLQDNRSAASYKLAGAGALLKIGQASVYTTALTLSLLMSAGEVAKGKLTIGDVVLVNQMIFQLAKPLSSLGTAFNSIAAAVTDMERMFKVLKTQPAIRDAPEARPLIYTGGRIDFNNVSHFDQETGQVILDKVNFTIEAGTTVAIVGPSGCGKSTLVRCLYRFLKPKTGQILVDGQDIDYVKLDSLREHVAIVPQDPTLFNNTIRYNIQYGQLNATDAEVEAAAKKAAMHDAIVAMPDGYDTVVGEKGHTLSTGERQRVAIARSLLKPAPIVVLDEATSALDTATEAKVLESLRKDMATRTCLIVAHRLSNIKMADRILVLNDHGEVEEQGTHAFLMAKKGSYYQLWKEQEKSEGTSVLS
jgi:ABC transporter ATM